MEYVLIVGFALLTGFCLGILVMMLLEASETKESQHAALRVSEGHAPRR